MCGIIGYLGRTKEHHSDDANNYIAEQYQEQMTRGQRGFGLVEIFDDGTLRVRRALEQTLMLVDLRVSAATHFLLHHRAPTSTSNMISQTHPVVIENDELKYTYYVMHNGVIYNPDVLKKEHEELGYTYGTEHQEYTTKKFLDSEALAIELARFFEKKTKVMKTRGSAAFIVAAVDKNEKVQKVYIGTNGGNQLSLSAFDNGFAFASEENYAIAEKLNKMQCIQFDAKYEKGVDGGLIGFVRNKDDIELKFAEQAYQSYSKDFPKAEPEAPKMGFQARDTTPALPPARKSAEKKEEGSAEGNFAQILSNLSATTLGNVFSGKDAIGRDTVVVDNFKKFTEAFVSGDMEKSEDIYNELLEGMDAVIDPADELSRVMGTELAFPKEFSIDGVIRAAEDSVGSRMKILASFLVPIFRLAAFYETALYLGNKLSIAKPEAAEGTPVTGLQVRVHRQIFGPTHTAKECNHPQFHTDEAIQAVLLLNHNETWGAVPHSVNLCKQPHWHPEETNSATEKADAAEVRAHFHEWGPRHIVSECGQTEFHMAPMATLTSERSTMVDDIANNAGDNVQVSGADDDRGYSDAAFEENEEAQEIQDYNSGFQTTRTITEQEAEASYSVFIQASESMETESIISEAEHVSEAVRTSASIGIEELLLEMQATAAEQGLPLRIAHYGDELGKIIDKTESRFTTIAKIVKAAKETQESEDLSNYRIEY